MVCPSMPKYASGAQHASGTCQSFQPPSPHPVHAGGQIARRLLASRAFREAPHAVIYVHCAKLREVDTTEVLHEAMAEHKR